MLNKKQIIALKSITCKSNNRPALQNVRLSSEKVEINNLEFSLQLFGNYPIQSDSDFLIPQTQFFKLAESLNYIHHENKQAIIGKGKSTFKFPAYNTHDYPDTPNSIDMDNLEFVTICNLEDIAVPFIDAAQFANKDKNRYCLNSVKIDFKNGLMIGTDQVQLRATRFTKSDKVESAILPSSLAPMLKALNDIYGNHQITIDCSKTSFVISSAQFRIVSRQVEAQFPNYLSAMDNFKGDGQIIGLKALETGLKDIDLVLCENAMNAKIESNLYNLTISASTPIGEASHEIAVDKANTTLEQEQYCGFNPNMLKNYLRTVKPYKLTNCEIVITSPKKPVIIRDDKGFLFMSPVAV